MTLQSSTPLLLMYFSPLKAGKKTLLSGFFCLVFLSGCEQKQPDPAKESGISFTYTFDKEGDGLVTFFADSTREAGEYLWRFGSNADVFSTTHPVIHYTFPGNGDYEVQLTHKSVTGEVTVTQTIRVSNRLARKFEDLPTDQRDTIRILCVMTHESLSKEFEKTNASQPDSYQNQVFINFLNRTLPNHPKELNGLVIKKIVYKLSAEEMSRFNASGDPIAFLNFLFTQREDPLFQKILDQKRMRAVSRIAFYLKDPAPGGLPKYTIGGYSVYEGSYFVLLSTNTYVHELGHSFGLDHDTLRNCTYYPIMTGGGTRTTENCITLWNDLPAFQVKGTVTSLALLRAPNYYEFAVPLSYRYLFPEGTFLKNIDITDVATTPYYKTGVDMSKTITDALVTQYNIRQKPAIATSLDNNPLVSASGRIANAPLQTVHCPIIR